MHILLISANRTEINMRTMPLGLACVAQGVAMKGHAVEMIDLVGIDDVRTKIKTVMERFLPDIIGVSIRNIDDQTKFNTRFLYRDDREIIALIRQLSDRPIVLGGAGYSMFPDAILADSDADMGIEGEGEAAFPMLIERLQNGQPIDDVPGLHARGHNLSIPPAIISNTDGFPLPDPHYMVQLPVLDNTWVPIQTRRGCPMDCSYCSTSSIEGRILRFRSIPSVVEWVRRLSEIGARKLYFVDNTFNLPRSYALSLCQALSDAALDVKWRCIVYPWRIDEALVAAMARSGCVEISLGSESADDDVLQKMNKRFRKEDVAFASLLFKKYGIKQMGFLMLGAPGDSRESVTKTLEFAKQVQFDMLKVTVGIRIYPNTALRDIAIEQGIIDADDNLLEPRFYLDPDLDENWIKQIVARYAAGNKNWITF
ncbi:MAG: B12-binding domain-containing radical SAM protein [Syntrophorhabdaceae bacterium]